MKKWRIVLSAVLVSIAAVACGTAIGCKKHSHSYADEWSTNSAYHWHEPTCGDTSDKGSYGAHNYDGNYHCATCNYDLELAGISVSKTRTEYRLENELTRKIPVNDIAVKAVAADGLFEAELSDDAYELEFYKGSEKLNNLNEADGGTYNIWATATISGEEYDSFTMVYVVDQVKSFERDSSAEFKREQELGLDEISDTWKFNVTYTSGKKKTVNFDDSHINVSNFSTYIVASNKTATVTYSETDCKGVEVTKSLDISYKIVKGENSNVTFHEYSYDALKEQLKSGLETGKEPGDGIVLKNDDFTGANSFLTLLSGTAQFRNSGSNQCVEIKGDTLSVTFEGVGILVIGCRSTGETNYSSIAVRDADGEYVAATYTTSASNPTILKDEDDYNYSVTGAAGANLLTFTITKPGTYTICTLEDVQVGGDIIETNRYTRIERLEITDIKTNSAREGE